MKQYKIEVSAKIYKYASDILISTGMQMSCKYMQHGKTSLYDHSLSVAEMCILISDFLKIKCDERALIRGALLHDYYLYDWHSKDNRYKLHAFRHAQIALKNAERDFDLGNIERNMIESHMFPLGICLPRYRESVILNVADKICACSETAKPILEKVDFFLSTFINNKKGEYIDE